MVEIRTLTDLTRDDLERIAPGYVSHEVYRVTKTETPQRTVFALELEALAEPYEGKIPRMSDTFDYYLGLLSEGIVVGAYDGTELVGLAICDREDWHGALIIWEFHVMPRRQGQGIGAQMMTEVVARARAEGLRMISVETSNTNVPAIRFYRKLGFTIDSFDLSFYSNEDLAKGEITLFMRRYLTA